MKEFCVDLEIAKELKENEFPQDTNFYHEIYKEKGFGKEILLVDKDKCKGWKNQDTHTFYSAPCSDEILKELPYEINGYVLEIIRYENGTIEADYTRNLQYEDGIEYLINSKKLFYKFSHAIAELWLDIKKEGYIK